MSNLLSFAERELDILEKTVPDAIVTPFKKEILALCDAFGESGQSGGSAPYTASAITNALKNLLLYLPICDITGHDSEWNEMTDMCDGETSYQNNRCSALFKDIKGSYYLDAIVWKGEEDYETFTGRVYIDDKTFELISSRQYVTFPFKPKTFYIDVVRVPVTKEEIEEKGLYYVENLDGSCYYTIIKDPSQLDEVFKYYIKG